MKDDVGSRLSARESGTPVRNERGPWIRLSPHPNSCDLAQLRTYARQLSSPLAVDLFCGAGGLSLGLQEAGFEVILGVDRDRNAVESHASNFGGASVLADLTQPEEIDGIVSALGRLEIDLVAGGPPCQPFSKAGENKIRSLIKSGLRPELDERRGLWQVFLDFVERVSPRAILIENVPDIALGRNTPLFRAILAGVERLGFVAHCRILKAWQFGVPQHRSRLFIVGVRPGVRYKWPEPGDTPLTVRDTIGDLPPVDGGDLTDPRPYGGPITGFQRDSRGGINGRDRFRIHDHVTRPVRADDLEAFRSMAPGDTYASVPQRLRRYRSDIFEDKYKRLDWDGLSRTITAHIAKDGYWYIHPTQDRTLTIREAARLQTFPDRFRFAGYRSGAFRQVGEAVPPRLGRELGVSLKRALKRRRAPSGRLHSNRIARRLVSWFDRQPEDSLTEPWRASGDLWLTLLGIFLTSGRRKCSNEAWSRDSAKWSTPAEFLADADAWDGPRLRLSADLLKALSQIASALRSSPAGTDLRPNLNGLAKGKLSLAHTLCGIAPEPFPTAGPSRVAGRIFGNYPADGANDGVNARLQVILATTGDDSGRAYAALAEVGDQFCTSHTVSCRLCPMVEVCVTAVRENGSGVSTAAT